MSWIERADWKHRSPEFGELSVRDGVVLAEYKAPASSQLWERWCKVPPHPNILAAVEPGFVRYAALDWKFEPTAERLATWGVVLVRMYEFLVAKLGAMHLAWFACPLVKFDLEGAVRAGFTSASPTVLPAEVMDRWPHCDESGLVFVIGQTLRALAVPPPELAGVIEQCIDPDPNRRFRNLFAVLGALRNVGGRPVPPHAMRPPRRAWDNAETALGLLATKQPVPKAIQLELALQDPQSKELLPIFNAEQGVVGEVDVAPAPEPPRRPPPPEPPKAPEQLLAEADARIGADPDDAQAHYARGKALLRLRRFVDSRHAFDRALVLRPQHLAAMMLRTAVDRSLQRIRSDVGVSVPKYVDLPLGPVRDALVAGRVDEAIAMLEPSILLGDLLSYRGRFEEALRVFEGLDGDAAQLGRARALLDLGRTDEALAIFDVVGNPGWVEIRR